MPLKTFTPVMSSLQPCNIHARSQDKGGDQGGLTHVMGGCPSGLGCP
ncbi:hypothetical protein CGRA01v4_01210 [Colletotrichum graminicola]|nr:hypothetical protein CGRA01v4_01210 [Colletotrichum graminicola]